MPENIAPEGSAVPATMATWRVFGLDRDFADRPASGWEASKALQDGREIRVTLGPVPEHVLEGVRGRWAHGLMFLNGAFTGKYAGWSNDELWAEFDSLLQESETEVTKVRGPHNLWLTIEVRQPTTIDIVEGDRLIIPNEGGVAQLREFASDAGPILDEVFLALLPHFGEELEPARATTQNVHGYLLVPGFATYGPTVLKSKVHGVGVITEGWDRQPLAAMDKALGKYAASRLSGQAVWLVANRWLIGAMSQTDDALRSFLFAFVGLEALVNQVAKRYQKSIMESMAEEWSFPVRHLAWPETRDSDAPFRNLVFRFALTAYWVDRENAEGDIDEFRALAEQRNNMAHGKTTPEDVDELPGHRAVALLSKYIGLVARAADAAERS